MGNARFILQLQQMDIIMIFLRFAMVAMSIQFEPCINIIIKKGVNTPIYQWQHYNISQHDIK